MDNYINAIQLNCNGAKLATHELIKYLIDNKIQIAFLQEPYSVKRGENNKIPGITSKISVYYTNERNFQTAIVCLDPLLNPLYFPQLSNPYLTLISVTVNNTQVFALSVYLPPRDNRQIIINDLNKILDFTNGKRILICGDFNARSNLWFDTINDRKSQIIEELLINHNLTVVNAPNNLPTFQTVNGESNIDLTITSTFPDINITNWETVNATSSDHNLIKFKINTNFGVVNNDKQTLKYKLDPNTITDEILIPNLETLKHDLDIRYPILNTTREIDQATRDLHQGLDSIFKTYGKKRKIFIGRPHWWNEEIERYRKIYLSKKSLFIKTDIENILNISMLK